MEPGLYEVSYTPYWNIGTTKTDTVRVRQDGKHESLKNGRFHVTQPYTGQGYTWNRIGD